MKVLGPYKFTLQGNEDNCFCGGDYCNILQNLDRITFQIPPSETCCGDQDSYTTGEDIEDNFTIGSYDYEVTDFGVCFDDGSFTPNEILLYQNVALTDNKLYKVCVCLSENNTGIDYEMFVGDSTSISFTGNGQFCFFLTFPALSVQQGWGIRQLGGDDAIDVCVTCMSICEAITFTAALVDNDGDTAQSISLTENENGSLTANSIVSGEIAPGCYMVKIATDCNDDAIYLSNCINIREAHECSLLLKYRNSNNAFGYDYSDANFFNYLRVVGMIRNTIYPGEDSEFLKSDNTNELVNAQVSEQHVVSINDVPQYIHRAIAIAVRHREFYINQGDGDTRYVKAEGDINIAWRKSATRKAPVTFEIISQDFDGINTFCG